MTDSTDYEKSAIWNLVAGIIFILVAALELTSDGDWLQIVLFGGTGTLFLFIGWRGLRGEEQSETT